MWFLGRFLATVLPVFFMPAPGTTRRTARLIRLTRWGRAILICEPFVFGLSVAAVAAPELTAALTAEAAVEAAAGILKSLLPTLVQLKRLQM
jgi:hypothetical protein